ncbi:MAG: class I SAM-dependent rRNA methyltransferase [Chlamydiae bacterium]|nr:class I SAM-dependent rRNA methyltransferase [Chlamydiota bacterium]MBI3278031.1 class I SAM-dependent rRNA methyltransferase [Chlamydiota bacterium]
MTPVPDPHFSRSKILNLLERSFEKRTSLFQITNAVRLVNGKGDELTGLTIDQYDRHFVVKVFDPVWNPQLDAIRYFLLRRFNPQYLIFKEASSEKTGSTYENLDFVGATSQTVVTENGLKFWVDLKDHFNTGLFLDMRKNRKMIGTLSQGKSVLNTFSYTCSFGVYCKSWGSLDVVNVDVRPKILEWGKKNYQLNDLSFSKNEFVRANAVQYLLRAVKKENKFDVIILDPPSFSRDEGKIFSVKKDLGGLIHCAIQILNPEGYLFVSTNFSGFSTDQLEKEVRKQAFLEKRLIKKISPLGQDRDFQGSGLVKESYLAALLVHFK